MKLLITIAISATLIAAITWVTLCCCTPEDVPQAPPPGDAADMAIRESPKTAGVSVTDGLARLPVGESARSGGSEAALIVVDGNGDPVQEAKWGWLNELNSTVRWAGETTESGEIIIAELSDRSPADTLVIDADQDFRLAARVGDFVAWPRGETIRLPSVHSVRIEFNDWRESTRASVAISSRGPGAPLPSWAVWSMLFKDRVVPMGRVGEIALALPGRADRTVAATITGGQVTPSEAHIRVVTHEVRFSVMWDQKRKYQLGLNILEATGSRSFAQISGRAWLVCNGSTINKSFDDGVLDPSRGFVISREETVDAWLFVVDEEGEQWRSHLAEARTEAKGDSLVVNVVKGDGEMALVADPLPFRPSLVIGSDQEGNIWSFEDDKPYCGKPWWRQTEEALLLGDVPDGPEKIWFVAKDGRTAIARAPAIRRDMIIADNDGIETITGTDVFRLCPADHTRVKFEICLPNSTRWIELEAVDWHRDAESEWHKFRVRGLRGRFRMWDGKRWRGLTAW